jgi:hypothetical protein
MPIKLALKKNGKWRKITDARSLNVYLQRLHFQMQDQRLLAQVLPQNYFAATADISNAYYQVRVSDNFSHYLCFSFNGKSYRYLGMPFGLRTAPYVFTRTMACVMNAIRTRWDVIGLAYLDDLIFLHKDENYLRMAMGKIMTLMKWLGWVMNEEKCDLQPKQVFEWLGWEWDSRTMTVSLPRERRRKAKHLATWLRTKTTTRAAVPIRMLARVIGTLSATRMQHRDASLHLTNLNSLKAEAAKAVGWDGEVVMESEEVQRELDWWIRTIDENEPRTLREIPPQATLTTEAAKPGWGAHVHFLGSGEHRWLHGVWSRRMKKCSSNCKEMTAVTRAITRLQQSPEGAAIRSVVIRSDNSSTVFDVNRRRAGPTLRSTLLRLLRTANRYCVQLTAVHVPGKDNVIADKLSRLSPSGDYGLKDEVLEQLQQEWGMRITADLFASGWNRKHETYWSLQRDRNAQGRNAFATQWRTLGLPLLHPPVPLIMKTLNRVRQERMIAMMVLPHWPNQPWSPLLREMTTKMKVLGEAEAVLVKGRRMEAADSGLPPGPVAAHILDTRTTQAKSSSTASCTPTAATPHSSGQ